MAGLNRGGFLTTDARIDAARPDCEQLRGRRPQRNGRRKRVSERRGQNRPNAYANSQRCSTSFRSSGRLLLGGCTRPVPPRRALASVALRPSRRERLQDERRRPAPLGMLRRGIGSRRRGARCAWGARCWGGPIVLTAVRVPARVAVTVANATLADAIAFEARGREGVGSRRPARGRVGVLVAVALLAGVALAAVVDTSGCPTARWGLCAGAGFGS
jgi:hypothetical protein